MASSEKVYVCGRCEDFGAPTLEELVVHMTNCGYPEIQKKDSEEEQTVEAEVTFFEDAGNSESTDGVLITTDKDTDTDHQEKLDSTLVPSPQNSFSTIPIDAGRSLSPTPFIWNKKTALLLLKLLKEHKGDMESPYIRRKTVWQKIAREMLERYGYTVSAPQCENKFKNMTNRYRRARDNNMRPDGKMKQTCFLYNELDEYYRNDPRFRVKPESRFGSKPKMIRAARFNSSNSDYIGRDQELSLTDAENFISDNNEGEPVWVQRVIDSLEKFHRENMQMQREFIDVLKKLVEKK